MSLIEHWIVCESSMEIEQMMEENDSNQEEIQLKSKGELSLVFSPFHRLLASSESMLFGFYHTCVSLTISRTLLGLLVA